MTDEISVLPLVRIGIVGFGTIGRRVASAVSVMQGVELIGVASRDKAKVGQRLAEAGLNCPALALQDLAARSDIVVDCATSSAFEAVAREAIEQGRHLVTVNGAKLLEHPELIALGRTTGGRITVATGALLGLDAIRAAAIDTIHSVNIVTRKPPSAYAGAPGIAKLGLSTEAIDMPTCLYRGSARAAARRFPANVNVAAALSMAGIGPDETRVEVWADPTVTRNTHVIEVDADSSRLTMKIENIPSDDNPATGRISALSVIAALNRFVSPVVVGS